MARSTATTGSVQSHETGSVQSHKTGFVQINNMTAKARSEHASKAKATSSPPVRPTARTEDLEFEVRSDRLGYTIEGLIDEAREQLAVPCMPPKDRAAAEETESSDGQRWECGFDAADETTDRMLKHSKKLFKNVAVGINDLELNGVQVTDPPASPQIEWLKDVPIRIKQWTKESKEQWKEPLTSSRVTSCPIETQKLITGSQYGYSQGPTSSTMTSEGSPGSVSQSVPQLTNKATRKDSRVGGSSSKTEEEKAGGWKRIAAWDVQLRW